MTSTQIITALPYSEPFLFVDELTKISNEGITGKYTFKAEAYFYKGHFTNHPVTPGVILTECMAQIGLACLGIFILKEEFQNLLNKENEFPKIALTSSNVDFYLPVFPGETITVISEKEVFRFNKLICTVRLYNQKQELVCRGKLSGMVNILK